MHVLRFLVPGVLAVLITACASSQKPFDQMTAQEHLAAAARENQRADDAFSKIRIENIEPPATTPSGELYERAYEQWGGGVPFTFEVGDPDAAPYPLPALVSGLAQHGVSGVVTWRGCYAFLLSPAHMRAVVRGGAP